MQPTSAQAPRRRYLHRDGSPGAPVPAGRIAAQEAAAAASALYIQYSSGEDSDNGSTSGSSSPGLPRWRVQSAGGGGEGRGRRHKRDKKSKKAGKQGRGAGVPPPPAPWVTTGCTLTDYPVPDKTVGVGPLQLMREGGPCANPPTLCPPRVHAS